jgi:hypothetical protein
MGDYMDERRKDERIPVEHLPECLKFITFKTGLLSEEFSAESVDASKYGLGFRVENINPDEVVQGTSLTVIVPGYDYKLKSKVVYTHPIGENKIHFGIEFFDGHPINKYHELLETKN